MCSKKIFLTKIDYNNPLQISQCSRMGFKELPGGCELLHKKRKVKTCSVCEKDYCNKPEGHSKANKMDPMSIYVLSLIVVSCKTYLKL